MLHADVLRSSSFRFAAILVAAIAMAYGSAGVFAFRSIGRDLHRRIDERTELMLERFEDRYEEGGDAALVEAVEAASVDVDPEDQLIWLGRRDGQRVAGVALPEPTHVLAGDVGGEALGSDPDDLYRVGVRRLGALRLVVATSYEEIDEILEHVLAVFAWATAFILVVAGGTAVTVARKGQRRIDGIVRTMQDVSRGRMTARVPIDETRDDLGRLSVGINEALEKLETTVDAIRQVTTDIAHDLRTPINRAAIMLEQARERGSSEDDRQLVLDRVEAELQRVMATFDALLRIAQIEAGARKSRFSPLSLDRIVRTVHEAYVPVANENGQRLELGELPDPDRRVDGDADLLTQLLANLVENSIRHCPAGTTTRLEGGTADSYGVWLSVSDDGPGISASERSDVLKRFYRVEKHRDGPGTGLGLALVKAIADLHGASLNLVDNEPGLRIELEFPSAKRIR